jgi:hypothetical protein
MVSHEEFLQLCAAATAGELTSDEQRRLDAHLGSCAECRRLMHEYAIASQHGAAALASEFPTEEAESDGSWSVEEAEKAFFKRLQEENWSPLSAGESRGETAERGQRFRYRPPAVHWREMWMSLAAVALLALALAGTAYRTGLKRGTEATRATADQSKQSASLEVQVSDLGYERAQLLAKLAEEDRTIGHLERQLSGQEALIAALKTKSAMSRETVSGKEITQPSSEVAIQRDQELATAQAKLIGLQKTIDTFAGQRDQMASNAEVLRAKVGDLTQLVRDRELEVEQKEDQVAKDKNLLEHDRDIRELIGARDLYIAEIHDVSGNGETKNTYGRIFYTRGKRLVFYAYDLDAQRSVQQASTFQAWGRRGPNKQQALNLGVLYEDNASKKRWVLRADNPKSLEDIDAVFVTIEPNEGSQHPSGKQLLFAYLRISPNHP